MKPKPRRMPEATLVPQPPSHEQRKRSLRMALLLGLLAATFFGGFILMMGLR